MAFPHFPLNYLSPFGHGPRIAGSVIACLHREWPGYSRYISPDRLGTTTTGAGKKLEKNRCGLDVTSEPKNASNIQPLGGKGLREDGPW